MPAGNTSLDLHSLYCCDHHGWLHDWHGAALARLDVPHATNICLETAL